jgi:hypothetical protein
MNGRVPSRSQKQAREQLGALVAQGQPAPAAAQAPLEPMGKARKKFDLKGLLTGGI